jgi:alanyl-tRNA synthetase
LITETLKLEETRFKQMLERGLKLLDEATGKLGKGAALDGEVAFKLYDTYGFPLDLTQDVLRGRGMVVDVDSFNAAMERQRAEARKAWAGSGEVGEEKVWFAVRERVGATEFLGYDAQSAEARVSALLVNGSDVQEAKAGTDVAVIVNQTPFYGESGGQMGDTGAMFTSGGTEIAISDTQKQAGDLIVHFGKVTRGTLKVGDFVELRIDIARRNALRANHSATHLLHEALRRRLGKHVTQKGSLVAPDRLRFDISQPTPIPPDVLRQVEDDVNARILRNEDVVTRLMTPDAAVQAGALALFGEKYGEEVRVVSMGGQDDDVHFSTELCGGTHVRRTGDIGLLRIVSEGAVSAGIRRIEALTGVAAREYLLHQEDLLQQAATALKASPAELPARVASLVEERRKLERELADARRALATGGGGGGGSVAEEVAGVKFAGRKLDGVPARELKAMVDDLKKKIGSGLVALVAVEDGKASVVVGVTDDLTARLNAVDFVRAGVAELGGKGGGGRPDMAQGGGPDGAKADAALAAIKQALAQKAAA